MSKSRAGYKIPVVRLQVVREDTINSKVEKITDAKDVWNLLSHLRNADRESFYCLHLTAQLEVISIEEVSRGSLNQSLVHPREVLKGAILSNAYAIILAHNHPGGSLVPSRDDLRLTERIAKAANLLRIPVQDHVIITANSYYSFQENFEQSLKATCDL